MQALLHHCRYLTQSGTSGGTVGPAWNGLCLCGTVCVSVERSVSLWNGLCLCGTVCVSVEPSVSLWNRLCLCRKRRPRVSVDGLEADGFLQPSGRRPGGTDGMCCIIALG